MKISDGPSFKEGFAVNTTSFDNASAALQNNKLPGITGRGESSRGNTQTDPVTALLDVLKLPQDKLSRIVLSFARFFSLPMGPALLSSLREAALGPLGQSAALGTAAAAAKGVQLTGQALLEYAAAIEGTMLLEQSSPEEIAGQKRTITGEQRAGERQNQKNPPDQDLEGGDGGGFYGGGSRGGGHHSGGYNGGPGCGRGDNGRSDPGPADAEGIRRRVMAVLSEKPLFDLLNRLPGKNSRRWILLPFSFTDGKNEFDISLRLLLNQHPSLSKKSAFPECLCADIKVSAPSGSSSGKKLRRWVIVLEKTEGLEGSAPKIRAELSFFKAPSTTQKPALRENQGAGMWPLGGESKGEEDITSVVFSSTEKKRLKKELARALDLPYAMVVIRDAAPPFADLMDNILQTVDEEV
ncbi:MAG: hypothetical protein LBP60_01310 [Spirochaetaceae bacterium]|jgi:hypothetical protein|nr:hypothetical protein [Spirochaetaceae bacterium]